MTVIDPTVVGAATRCLLDSAGAALRALDEKVVLLAYYRGGGDFSDERYSVRLELEGAPGGIQASAASPAEAYARATLARRERQELAVAEEAVRAEICRRLPGRTRSA